MCIRASHGPLARRQRTAHTPGVASLMVGAASMTVLVTGCAQLRYKPAKLSAEGEAVIVVERSQPMPTDCKQVGFVDARNVHGDPVYMRNKLRNDSAKVGATHLHIDDLNRLYADGTAFVCPGSQAPNEGMRSASGLTPVPTPAPPANPTPPPGAPADSAAATATAPTTVAAQPAAAPTASPSTAAPTTAATPTVAATPSAPATAPTTAPPAPQAPAPAASPAAKANAPATPAPAQPDAAAKTAPAPAPSPAPAVDPTDVPAPPAPE